MSSKPASFELIPNPTSSKKFRAIFYDKDGKKIKKVDFGARGYSDFTLHKDKSRKASYIARHGSGRENWDDPMTAGSLSRYVLWELESLEDSIYFFADKFKLEFIVDEGSKMDKFLDQRLDEDEQKEQEKQKKK